MKKSLFILIISLTIFSGNILLSQVYFVDYDNGNNTANGLTQQTAWKHSPGDPLATGIPATKNLLAGDSVIFKGGVKYLGQVNIKTSGVTGKEIVFIGNSGWGDGKATFDMQFIRQFAFKGNAQNIIIKGFNFFNYATGGSDYPVYPVSGSKNWIIDQSAFAFVQNWSDATIFPEKWAIRFIGGVSNMIVRNCEFFASGRTIINIRDASYITIENCDFGGINRGDSTGWFSVAIRMETTANNILIRKNKFHDGWQYGGDVDPELNHAPSYVRTGSATTLHAITIDSNYFFNNKQFKVGSGTGHIQLTAGKNIKIRNNVSVNSVQIWGANILIANVDSVWLENNSFIDRPYSVSGKGLTNIHIYNRIEDNLGDSIWIRNNIFWNDYNEGSNVRLRGTVSDGFRGVINFNAYFRASSSIWVASNGSGDLSSWQSLPFSPDKNSQEYIIGPYGTGAWNYFELIPSNPAISSSGKYILTSAAPDFIKSGGYGGVSIGAYQFSSGGVITDNIPPNLLSAAVINPATIELTFSEALESSSALNRLNYSINNGIAVNSVTLSADAKKVTMTTTQHTANVSYTVVVSNVKDLAGNTISAINNSAVYSYVGDTTPPSLLSAVILNSTTIDLFFSEELETNSAQTKSNYSINSGITVNTAVQSNDKKKVTLSTTQHITNQSYTITVSNVRDLAGNVISSNNSVQYTFIDNTVGNLKANVKIFLQGPFQNNIMITELSNNAFIPSQQPYNTAPWNYSGDESISSSSSSRVDWVLVELRSAQNPAQVISRRAGLLRNDGRIMEPDGTLGVTFKNLLYASYYIAVYHRNHLAVMTSAPVLFSPDNSLYDFTNSPIKAYGENAMAEITAGVFGMYAGDGNGDGEITLADQDDVWVPQNGSFGYLNGDFNLDCGVTIHDVTLYWNINNGRITQVP